MKSSFVFIRSRTFSYVFLSCSDRWDSGVCCAALIAGEQYVQSLIGAHPATIHAANINPHSLSIMLLREVVSFIIISSWRWCINKVIVFVSGANTMLL